MAIDLSTTYMGVPLKNPIIIGSGPTTGTPEIMEKAAKLGGWGGLIAKTNFPEEVIKESPLTTTTPYFSVRDACGINKWKPVVPKVAGDSIHNEKRLGPINHDYSLCLRSIRYPAPPEKRSGIGAYYVGRERYTYLINKTKELIKETGCKLSASIYAFTEEGWDEEIDIVNKSKADMVELNLGCPSLGVKDTYATKGNWFPQAAGIYPSIVEKWTKYCVERIKIPVGVKLPPVAPFDSVRVAFMSGAMGIQWADGNVTMRDFPSLAIDVDVAAPIIPGLPFTNGVVLTSAGLPHICGAIAHFKMNNIDIDISGCGGVRNYLDIIRILMSGATSAQVCTATVVEGVEVGDQYLDGITSWMENKGYKSIQEIIGIAATKEKLTLDLEKAPRVVLPQILGGSPPKEKIVVDEKRCIACGRCEAACYHLALKLDNRLPVVDRKLCEVCTLCVEVCPMRALSLE